MEVTKSFGGKAQTTARLNAWRGFATPHTEDSRHFHSANFHLRTLGFGVLLFQFGQTGFQLFELRARSSKYFGLHVEFLAAHHVELA